MSSSEQIRYSFYSAIIHDTFDIYINGTGSADRGPRQYVYYMDAGIKSGKELRKQLGQLKDTGLANRIFVGIGHRGNFHEKRRRDFIPPLFDPDTTHGANIISPFYLFLSQELIPSIEVRYGPPQERAIIGHSFGGLFVFYALFQPDRLFQRFYALSPSLWVNEYNAFDREKTFFTENKSLDAFLYLSAGGAEKINLILKGNRRMRTLLNTRQYQGLILRYQEFPGKTHNSQVPLSIRYVLKHLNEPLR